MELAKLIQPGFSTADAEYPEIYQEDGDVVLRYKDWQENIIEVFFAEVMAFKWQMAEMFYEGEDRDDSCYVIENSKWLETHMQQSMASETEEYNHYKFNFNGCGQLEILATSFTKKTYKRSREGLASAAFVLCLNSTKQTPLQQAPHCERSSCRKTPDPLK